MNASICLNILRDLIQQDIAHRGLGKDPASNLLNHVPDDFADACTSIAAHPNPHLAVVTGFFIADAVPPSAETDGPLGAVFLQRALAYLGIPVVILTDSFCIQAVRAGLNAAGQDETSAQILSDLIDNQANALSEAWDKLFHERAITHLVALERVGPASDQKCYSMRGIDISSFMYPAEHLFDRARAGRLTTIGIGDGGNEIGMGKIPASIIARNIPRGDLIACRTATDYLIVAGISNWGAYALASGIAYLLKKPLPSSFFEHEAEYRILTNMIEQGSLVDGVTKLPQATVDGIDFERYIQILTACGQHTRNDK